MRITNSTYWVLFIAILLFPQINTATHLVGGDASYKFVEFNSDSTLVTFDVLFKMYRDSEGIGLLFDNDADFGIYRQLSSGDWELYESVSRVGHSNVIQIPIIDDPCRDEPDNVGVQYTTYAIRIELEVGDSDYMVAYQRATRSESATNVFAQDIGAVFDVIITPEAQRLGNSSPVFSENPPIFICTGFELNVDASGTDKDGDSLSYKFCTPIIAGGANIEMGNCFSPRPDVRQCLPPFNNISFRPPFTAEAPMGGDPLVSINAITGILSGIPSLEAQYIVGMCIEEWRDGIMIGSVRRDFQFNALSCTKDISAELIADEVEIDTSLGVSRMVNIIKACGDSTVYFESTRFDNQMNSYSWFIESATGEEVFNFTELDAFSTTAVLPELGEYFGTLIINENFNCPDTAFFRVERLPLMRTDFEFALTDSCYSAPIQFTDMSWAEQADIIRWEWDYDNGDTDNIANPLYEFENRGSQNVQLISFDTNGCRDTMTVSLDYNPPHDEILLDTITVNRCFGETFEYFGRSLETAGIYDTILKYDTGCDSLNSQLVLNYFTDPILDIQGTVLCPGESFFYRGVEYSEAGVFPFATQSLVHGCDSILHEVTIAIEELPMISIQDNQLIVPANTDFSLPVEIDGSYSRIQWSPSDGLDCTDCINPIVNFDTDTTYVIEFVTDDGCVIEDSIRLDFVVEPTRYYIPNVISGGATLVENRFFYLQTLQEAFEDVTYDIRIYDRWGGLIHEQEAASINDRTAGWSGINQLSGTYVYNITVHEFFRTENLIGTFTLTN